MTHSDTRPKTGPESAWRDSTHLAALVIDGEYGRSFPAPGALMIATWVSA